MKKKIKFALIGIGYWGPNVLRTLNKIKDIDVKYVVDIDPDRINYVSKNFKKVIITNDLKKVLNDKEVSNIIICTPAKSHFSIAKKCLLANKNCLIEKPAVLKISELTELNKIAKKNNLILLSGDIYLYSKAIQKIKKLIWSKNFGKIRYFFSQRLNLGRIRNDINVIWNLATHDISIILDCLKYKKPIQKINRSNYFLSSKLADSSYLSFKFKNNIIANIFVSWIYPEKIRKLIICGEKQMLIFDDLKKEIYLMENKIIPIHIKNKNMEYDKRFNKKFTYIKGKSVKFNFNDDEPLLNEVEYFKKISLKQKYSANYISGYNNTLSILNCIKSFKY